MNTPTEDLQRYKKVLKEIDETDTKLNTAVNNQLFEEKTQSIIKKETIYNLLKNARLEADAGNLVNAESDASLARGTLYDAMNKPSTFWRFSNLFGGFVWIYLFTILSIVFLFFYLDVDSDISSKLEISTEAIYATSWGIIGSIIRSIWKLKTHVSAHKYRTAWKSYFIISPFLGGMFGAIIYLIVIAGLFSITQDEKLSITNISILIPITAFAGFNWDWAVKKFSSIENRL